MSTGLDNIENLEYTGVEDQYPEGFGERFVEYVQSLDAGSRKILELLNDYDEWAAAADAPTMADRGKYLDALDLLERAGWVEFDAETRTVRVVKSDDE